MQEDQGDNSPARPEVKSNSKATGKESPSKQNDEPEIVTLTAVTSTSSATVSTRIEEIRTDLAKIKSNHDSDTDSKVDDEDIQTTSITATGSRATDNDFDLGLATEEEIERAKVGVQEFKKILSECGPETREFLLYDPEGEKLQLMFLGVKPVSLVNYRYHEVMSGVILPERFQKIGDMLYNRQLVHQTITSNSDIFTDFGEHNEEVDAYMRALEKKNPEVSDSSPEDTAKIGILLGFPKDSVLDFAKFHEDRSRIFDITSWGRERYTNPDGTINGAELNELLKTYHPDMFPANSISYTADTRIVHVHGFDYSDAWQGEGDPPFVRKVNRIYNASGIEHLIPNIDTLPDSQLSETRGFVGQRSALRLIDPTDRTDMQRFRDIIRSLPGGQGTHVPDGVLIDEASHNQPGNKGDMNQSWYFGVAGAEGNVEPNETGELQGWVVVNPDREAEKIIAKGYLPKGTPKTRVLEVAFAKHPDSQPGQIASALRQVCTQISQIDGVKQAESKAVAPNTPVVAYTEPYNAASIEVLKASGFEEKGPVDYDVGYNSTQEYLAFVLNWKTLNQKMHDSGDRDLFS